MALANIASFLIEGIIYSRGRTTVTDGCDEAVSPQRISRLTRDAK